MAEILIPVTVATGLVLILSAIVLAARGMLMPRGTATVTVNEHQQFEVRRGERLLWALAGNGVLLPAACGGRGSCGQCRVTVVKGGGPLLPVETALISRRKAAAGARLACMVRVRRDLVVRVPDGILEAQRLEATVEHTRNVTSFLREITLRLPTDAEFAFEAGDYVLVEAPPGETRFEDFDSDLTGQESWRRQNLQQLVVRRSASTVRAYSIGSAPNKSGVLQLIVRIALPPAGSGAPPGQVSSWLFGLVPGDRVSLSGPFGDFHVRDSEAEMVFVGGGAGIAPLRAMIFDQLQNRASRRRISLWYGARDRQDVCYQDEFDELAARYKNFSWHIALSEPRPESDWSGRRGLIHAVLRDEYIATHESPETLEYYLCGPPLMSSAVLAMLEDYGVAGDQVLFDDFGS